MKKIISALLIVALISALLFTASTTSTFAGEKEIEIELDGVTIDSDVNPRIIDGTPMVPLRKILEEMGALVKWDSETKTVSARKSSKTVTITLGSDVLTLDKGKTDDDGNPITETVTLDAPAQLVGGRTLIPLSAIAECFDLDAEWDEENGKLTLTSSSDDDDSRKENTGTINLTDMTTDAEGVEIKDNGVVITSGGDFTLIGILDDGNITVSSKEKVKLRLSGVTVTSSEGPCIFAEEADKVYITLTSGTENTLTARNSENGAIYSKENLEIKGDGALVISSESGHGIKASDNLTIENGEITIEAFSDGIHVNDTFKMTGGRIDITSDGDGIDSESIVIISGGEISIETNGTPISQTSVNEEAANTNRFPMKGNAAEVEFEKSTKGINAEWMMSISGGNISVNSASHAIHCGDEIEITGGAFELSSKYEKGISAHGNLTIDGSDKKINVAKSTEGIESKNILTINDGIINVVASDDALNATGGKSGEMQGFGQNGGNKGNGANRMPKSDADIPEGFPTGDVRTENMAKTDANGNAASGARQGKGDVMRPSINNAENGEPTPPAGNAPSMNGNANPAGNIGGIGGFGSNMKDCLIINGGVLELCAGDDCLDSNGNLIINGGTVKATNPKGSFSGATAIVDPDGQVKISEKANLIFASGSGSERSLNLSQNAIVVYCEAAHNENETISVCDNEGNTVFEYTPAGKYSSVLVASEMLSLGETYTITVGEERHETVISSKSTVIGTQAAANKGFGREQNRR